MEKLIFEYILYRLRGGDLSETDKERMKNIADCIVDMYIIENSYD